MFNGIKLWVTGINYGQRDQLGGKFVVMLVTFNKASSKDYD